MHDVMPLALLTGTVLAAAGVFGTLIPDPRSEFQREIKERSIHEFTVRDIDGNSVELSRYRGKVLLVVNIATLAPTAAQLYSLQSLQTKFTDRGFTVLAFPTHSFGKEPRTDADVKQTCHTRYKVGFDLFGKVAVLGKDQCPLYSFLTSREKHPQFGGAVDNDYAKFLVGKDGRVAGRFKAMQDPLTPEIVQAIERALIA